MTGSTNTGKSTMFNTLADIFGRLLVKSSNSSAAGIRQSIGRSAKAVLCDEFEKSRHRPQEILEMLRSSSRGEKVIRGTTWQKAAAIRIAAYRVDRRD